MLRTNMQYVEVDTDKLVFAVTSSLPEEGKSTVAVNLALALALAKQRVVLVECDLRGPSWPVGSASTAAPAPRRS